MKQTGIKYVAAVAMGFAMVAASPLAKALTITTDASTPTGNVEISQVNEDDFLEQTPHTASSINGWREVGQTFTVTTPFTVDKISVKFLQPSGFGYLTTGLQLHLKLESVDNISDFIGTAVGGFPENGVTGAFSADTDLWMTFDLTDVALSAGVYAFRVGFSSDAAFAAANAIGDRATGAGGFYYLDESDDYAGGQAFRAFPSAGTAAARAEDLAFVIQSTAIPEPTSVMLTIAGLGLFGLIRRKQR